MTVPVLYTYFNGTLFCLIDDLSTVYPEEKWKFGLIKMIMTRYLAKNVHGIRDAFNKGVENYRTKIQQHDEEFFLSTSTSSIKAEYKAIMADLDADVVKMKDDAANKVGKSTFSQLIDLVKQRWRCMDPENKDVVWLYMNKLLEYDTLITQGNV